MNGCEFVFGLYVCFFFSEETFTSLLVVCYWLNFSSIFLLLLSIYRDNIKIRLCYLFVDVLL